MKWAPLILTALLLGACAARPSPLPPGRTPIPAPSIVEARVQNHKVNVDEVLLASRDADRGELARLASLLESPEWV